MNETVFGNPWDVSYDPASQTDMIMVEGDSGDTIYLSADDLSAMIRELEADV
jgi:hypothetical protein